MDLRSFDTVKDEDSRLRQGAFFTPKAFVDFAHARIEESFGTDWKEKYIVWDCAWGTGNLTHDYSFHNLYASTLEQEELTLAANVNPEATKFQYDFLNDSFDKLPAELQDALTQGKPIIFFINPPYATASAGVTKGGNKVGSTKTRINEEMLAAKIGSCSQNLYAQFLYRITTLKKVFNADISICLFSPTLFLTGPSYEKFRSYFLDEFGYMGGWQFMAGHFSGVKSNWGILFSIWKNTLNGQRNDFVTTCIDVNEKGVIVPTGKKTVYNTDGQMDCSTWIKEETKHLKGEDSLQMTSALGWREDKQLVGKLVKGALGYYVNTANNVNKSTQDVYIFSSCAAMGHGISIMEQNFERVVVNFAARRLIKGNWMNWADEFLVPNVNHPNYQEFLHDSIVYSIFETKGSASALRNVSYKNTTMSFNNSFFWLGTGHIRTLATIHDNKEVLKDLNEASESYVFKRLSEITLSPEAQKVIDAATALLNRSFAVRESISSEHPEYHLNAWDAGWYQIKKLANAAGGFEAELNAFAEAFAALSTKMRPMVYEIGFLKN